MEEEDEEEKLKQMMYEKCKSINPALRYTNLVD